MTDSKKIIIIGPAHPLRGGLASYNERLARAFTSAGHKVIIYTFSLQYPKFIFPGTTQYSTEPKPMDIDIRVEINSVNPLNWLLVGNRLKKEMADIIVVRFWLPLMGPALGSILRIAKKNKHTRTVCIADNIIPHEKRAGDTAFTKWFVKPVDAFITMSQKVLDDVKSFGITKPARFVPHPLYDNFGDKVSKLEARTKLGINPAQRIILFFGFIRKYKGLDILLDAMAILKKQSHTDIKLLIAGEFYEDKEQYAEQIRLAGIEDQLIERTDFIKDSEVRYYISAADCVVQPYRHATQSGVTPLAYHFEKPMIVTNVGGLPSLVPDGKVGLVAEPNASSLAAKIVSFYEMGEAHFLPYLLVEKKKYSWKNMVEAILAS